MHSVRLNKLVAAIPECGVLADVGCDHGYVGIRALEKGVARKVIFTDISLECLKKAERNCPAALKDRAEFVCRNGLGDIRADTAAICGMGGLEIISILQGAKCLPNDVVLQPMRNIADVRKYIAEHYTITLDVTICDGKYYSIIVGRNLGTPTKKMTELEEQFGITNVAEPSQDYLDFLVSEEKKLREIAKQQRTFKRDNNFDELDARRKILEQALASALSSK